MTKQLINRGTVANDGTGDDLRAAGEKINDNFNEVYSALGNGSSILFDTTGVSDGKGLIYDSSVSKFIVSDFNTFSFTVRDDSSTTSSITSGEILTFSGGTGIDAVVTDNTVTLDIDSTVTTLTGSQVLTNKSIAAGSNTITGLTNSNLSGSAAITNANLANSSITIRDDSSTEDAVSLGETLIVTGANGITTSVASNTLTITGAATSLSYTKGTFTGDGSTQAFTIDSGRAVDDVLVYVNGFLLTPTDDYTISSTTLTFTTAPASSAEIVVRYLPLGTTGVYTNDTATGDGSTQAFTIDSGRTVEDVIVTVNGVTLVPTTDYTISGTTLTFTTAPASSAEISIRYLRLT